MNNRLAVSLMPRDADGPRRGVAQSTPPEARRTAPRRAAKWVARSAPSLVAPWCRRSRSRGNSVIPGSRATVLTWFVSGWS